MNINEIKDLMAQFDQSSLREFSYKNQQDELTFSKNEGRIAAQEVKASPLPASVPVAPIAPAPQVEVVVEQQEVPAEAAPAPIAAEGDVVESPLVGVPAFVNVGDQVKKGQTLMIIEAMKVMNEVPAPKDGIITEVLVQNEEMVEFGKGLVRIK